MRGANQGATLANTLMAMAFAAISAASVMTSIGHGLRAQKGIESKNTWTGFNTELSHIFTSRKACEGIFQDPTGEAVSFKPPGGTKRYSVPVQLLQLSSTRAIRSGYPSPQASIIGGAIGLEEMSLDDSGVPPEAIELREESMILNLTRHLVKFRIKGKRFNDIPGAPYLTREHSIVLLTGSDNRVFGCVGIHEISGSLGGTQIESAIAKRAGVTIQSRKCHYSQPIHSKWYIGQTPAQGCIDVDGPYGTNEPDGICDNDQLLSSRTHPMKADSAGNEDPFWTESFPSRNLGLIGSAPLTGVEGRCPVYITSIPEGENPNDVFVLFNGQQANGLGCNRTKGWIMGGCTAGNLGPGSAAVGFDVDPNGNDICYTEDFKQPHKTEIRAWSMTKVSVHITCQRIKIQL